MKWKRILICMIVAAVILSSVWFSLRPKSLGNISHAYTEATTSSSNFSFSGEAGERIKISFASDIKKGDLSIVLYDSNENPVCELARAKELVTYYTFNYTDTYVLTAKYTDFIGNFKVRIYPAK